MVSRKEVLTLSGVIIFHFTAVSSSLEDLVISVVTAGRVTRHSVVLLSAVVVSSSGGVSVVFSGRILLETEVSSDSSYF